MYTTSPRYCTRSTKDYQSKYTRYVCDTDKIQLKTAIALGLLSTQQYSSCKHLTYRILLSKNCFNLLFKWFIKFLLVVWRVIFASSSVRTHTHTHARASRYLMITIFNGFLTTKAKRQKCRLFFLLLLNTYKMRSDFGWKKPNDPLRLVAVSILSTMRFGKINLIIFKNVNSRGRKNYVKRQTPLMYIMRAMFTC